MKSLTPHDIKVMLISILAALSCSLVGVFLLLRRMSMLADAISHSVLPGIALAFFLLGSRSSLTMVIGAATFGVICAYSIQAAATKFKLQKDASIGINFTFLFALGIILISIFGKKVDLDPDCVIYGEVAYAPYDVWITESGMNMGPRAFYSLGFSFLINLVFVVLGYYGLRITTFDENFAKSVGVNVNLWQLALVLLTSITTVATFDIAGAILSLSYMILPAATAYLLTEKLVNMIIYTCLFAVLSSILGYFAAIYFNSSISGAIAVCCGMIFFIIFVLNIVITKQNNLSFFKK